MTNLSAKDYRGVLEISGTAFECATYAEFQQETLRLVERTMGARSSCFFLLTQSPAGTARIHTGVSRGVEKRRMDHFIQYYWRFDPLVTRVTSNRLPDQCTVAQSPHVIGAKQFYRSAFYHDFLSPQAIHYVLRMTLYRNGRPSAMIGLHRPKSKESFGKREVAIAKLLVPALSAAQEKCLAQDQIAEREAIMAVLSEHLAYEGVVIVNADLRAIYASDGARKILAALAGGATTGAAPDELPESLDMACRRLKQALAWNRPLTGLDMLDITPPDQSHRFNVRIRPLDCGAGGLRLILSFKQAEDDVVRLDRMKDLGLTRREINIAQLVSMGLTNPEVADKLCISVRTVQNHLRSIYEKTGVHNRTSLLYRLAQPK
jgi:DNA-binding CsgD family transcriptional regulator